MAGRDGRITVVRTVCGWGRRVQMLPRRPRSGAPAPPIRSLVGVREPLILDRPGLQRRGGAKLDQVDGTTCGSAVLVALAAWADPAETQRLDGAADPAGFGARYDARQLQVHRESTRFWPRALGTTPWGMVAWLRRHVPAAGRYRVRLVDDTSAADVRTLLAEVATALAAGRPVPLAVGAFVPRHYCLALSGDDVAWRVYEPTSGEVRVVPVELVAAAGLTPLLGFAHLQAVLLPA